MNTLCEMFGETHDKKVIEKAFKKHGFDRVILVLSNMPEEQRRPGQKKEEKKKIERKASDEKMLAPQESPVKHLPVDTPNGNMRLMTTQMIEKTLEYEFLRELFCGQDSLIPADQVVICLKEFGDFDAVLKNLQDFQQEMDIEKHKEEL